MNGRKSGITRRGLVGGAAAAAGLLAAPAIRRANASSYLTRNLQVVIPSGAGGSAERFARAFEQAWAPLLGRPFEYSFHPGAGGQIGYEVFVNSHDHDGHTLLFGNMGSEMVMYATQDPNLTFPDDFFYFCRADVDDQCIFVRQDSPIATLEQLVEVARTRMPTVGLSRIPHPGSIGLIEFGRQVGVEFNLIPYGGGGPTLNSVIGGEVDIGLMGLSPVLSMGDEFHVIAVFNRENVYEEETNGAPPINSVFGTTVPDVYSSRAWAVHTRWAEENPEQFEFLSSTAREAHASEEFRAAVAQTGTPVKGLAYGDREVCTEYALGMIELATRYKDILTGG